MLHLHKPYLPLLATASLLTLAACSTIDEDIPAPPSQEPAAVLNINIYAPNMIESRADDDRKVSATNEENALHDVSVWAYENGSTDEATPVGYAELNNIVDVNATRQTVQMLLPKSLMNDDNTITKKLDFFIMANTRGLTSLTQPAEMVKRGDLKKVAFGHIDSNDDYGITTATKSIPSTGLPISQIATNQTIVLQAPGQNLLYRNELDLMLTRAVSKIQFYFTKANGMTDVEVTKIEINGSAFPTTEYIFPIEQATGLGNVTVANLPKNASDEVERETGIITYNNDATTPITIKELTQTQNPDMFKWDTANETAQQYVDKITKNSDATRNVTLCCTTYLRETDGQTTKDADGHPIMGTIHYKIGTETYSKTFALLQDNDFVRNHQWFVYGYFNGAMLEVEPQVLDWITGTTIDIRAESGAGLTLNRAYTRDLYDYIMWSETEESASTYDNMTWDDNYCAISYGYSEDGRPLYAPYLEVRTTSNNLLTLSTDNSEFGFIEVAHPDSEDESSVEYGEFVDKIVISPGKQKSTYFYIVPKRQFDQVSGYSRYANVFLTESAGANFTVSRLPWNHTLPGNAIGETVQVYYVSPNDYLKADANARLRNVLPEEDRQDRQFYHLESGGWLFYYGEGNEE